MEIGEIISDAITYPLNNIKALVIYAILGIIVSFILLLTGVSVGGSLILNNGGLSVLGIIGIIISILIYLLINGYGLDVIKIGIDRGAGSPGIDFGRQVSNGIKLIIIGIAYMIIPFIIMLVLIYINKVLGMLIGGILFIVFGFALMMAQCRLADSEDLGYSLNIVEAMKDVSRVGIIKIIAVMVILVIISFIINIIAGAIISTGDVGTLIGALISGILSIYLNFTGFRATGLLYSDI